MKTYLFFLFLILGRLLSAQQAEEFRIIKDYFDNQESLIKSGFAKKYKTLTTDSSKVEIRKQYTEFMSKLDSIRNVAYLGALIKVKNREDLHLITKTGLHFAENKNIESKPEFPNGLNSLRDKVANLFYSDCLQAEKKEVSTMLSFVVEEDGSITDIRASGDDANLNKQAEIALYLLPEKFTKPATINGNAVRYSFQMPLVVKFD
jgi:hypothetical protein